MKHKLAFLFILIFFIQNPSLCFSLFKKKDYSKEPELPPMVQTVEEWMEEGTPLKVDLRTREEDKGEKDEKYIPPKEEVPIYLIPYNMKTGSRELNLSDIYKNQLIRTPFVSDSSVQKAVYGEINYYPQTAQIASTLYMLEFDENLSKKERFTNTSIFEHKRHPLISTALPYLKQGLFSTLTVVDFSSDGKTLLVKQKIGSNKYGIYETYAWVYFFTDEKREENKCYQNNIDYSSENSPLLENDFSTGNIEKTSSLTKKDIENFPPSNREKLNSSGENSASRDFDNDIENIKNESEQKEGFNGKRWYNLAPRDFRVEDSSQTEENIGFGVRLNLLNEFIKAYWFNRKGLILNHTRWDIRPLGFNSSNKNEIVVKAIIWTKDGREVSLGLWGVNLADGMPRLIPATESVSVESNALTVTQTLNPR